jgi:hypothetical protein
MCGRFEFLRWQVRRAVRKSTVTHCSLQAGAAGAAFQLDELTMTQSWD